MIEHKHTSTTPRNAWSVEGFERFWADHDPAVVSGSLTDDIVGYWAGREKPVRGKEAYTACIAALAVAPCIRNIQDPPRGWTYPRRP